MNPKTAQFVQACAKYQVFPWIVSQTGAFRNSENSIDQVIWQNTDHLVFRSEDPELLNKLAHNFAGVYEPYMTKEIKFVPRQTQYGWETVDYESFTERDKGAGSVTTGQRERPLIYRWYERVVKYFHPNEQAELLKKTISRLKTGMCISKIEGEIDVWTLPFVEVDDELSKELNEESLRWLRGGRSSNSSRDTYSQTHWQPNTSTATSNTSNSQSRPSNVISEHWSQVEISTLSRWLWPENEESSSTD